MKFILSILFVLSNIVVLCQNNDAIINGQIKDENNRPIKNATISILGKNNGTFTNEDGFYLIKVPTDKSFALVFSHSGFFEFQKNFYFSKADSIHVDVVLKINSQLLDSVVITDNKERKENGLVKINAKDALILPSTSGGVEGLIKTLVGSNNELTSQYSVRGGNYDENIVYINDFEIYRPYLVSNGQQEGLSFINPSLVKNINFYTGGFQSKFGDKMSSVLDIQYKKPIKNEGAAYVSLLEQGVSYCLNDKANKSSIVFGFRNKSNKQLLSSQQTIGAYLPSAYDFQSLITYNLNSKNQFELLGIVSQSQFTYFPESVKKTSSVFSPLFTSSIGLDTYFEGQEKDDYHTSMLGATFIQSPTKSIKLKWLLSYFKDVENENYDIAGSYLFGDRDFDKSSSSFGEIINPLGAGTYLQFARNHLNIDAINFSHRGSYELKNHLILWGNTIEETKINDKVKSFEYQDSAGYSLPYQSDYLSLYNSINSKTNLTIQKYSGYIQDNIHLTKRNDEVTLQAGVRYNYNSLNNEFFISPRVQTSWKPFWKRDMIFRLSAGVYNQPPFYRELKKYDGSLNYNIKSQKSIQIVTGLDYQFVAFNNKPFRLTSEAYYKQMRDIIPYDIDNVKIKYLGNNNAKAYATGLEVRLFSELIKDAESWISVGLMSTKENLDNDYYTEYKNASGAIITSTTQDQVIKDSIVQSIGYLRRPSDRMITVGLFLQDYLATNKNFKVHINLLYGSNMPYNIPNSVKYRNGLTIDPYIRADIGFSARLLKEKSTRRSHDPFRNIDNIWASFEVFNIIDKANTISYQLIKDFANNIFALPNKLTPRLLNVKLISRF